MTTIDERVIQEIVDRITRVTRPGRVILFGSGATEKMTLDSDIDLLVLEPDVQDTRAESRRLRESLDGVEYRYPGDYPEVSPSDAGHCLDTARNVRERILRRLPSGILDQGNQPADPPARA